MRDAESELVLVTERSKILPIEGHRDEVDPCRVVFNADRLKLGLQVLPDLGRVVNVFQVKGDLSMHESMMIECVRGQGDFAVVSFQSR